MTLLENLPPDCITAGPAFVSWPLERSGSFSVRSLRQMMVKERFVGVQTFPSTVVWSKVVPTKVQGFTWMVWHKKIASLDNLQKRGMILTNWCVLCERDAESVDHLFLRCPFSSAVWDRVSSKLSLFGPRVDNIRGLFETWKGMNCAPIFAAAEKAILHGVLWHIWLERNERIFNEASKSDDFVASRTLRNVGRWLSSSNSFSAPVVTLWNALIFDPG
ncbi:Putative ribonuclease H protein At1g65750 [Linum perenne]